MTTFKFTYGLTLAAALFLGSARLHAAEVKNYQVTGPVLEVTPTSITVQKGDEKWQLARDKDTKIKGDLKVGSKVTIQYQMSATQIEVKDAAKAKK